MAGKDEKAVKNGQKKPVDYREPYQFKPGQVANPLGRPKGARNALSEAFIKDILEDWKVAGPSAIQACRLDNPGVYLKVVASLVPKELSVKNGSNQLDAILDQLDDGQLAQLDGILRSLGASKRDQQAVIENKTRD